MESRAYLSVVFVFGTSLNICACKIQFKAYQLVPVKRKLLIPMRLKHHAHPRWNCEWQLLLRDVRTSCGNYRNLICQAV